MADVLADSQLSADWLSVECQWSVGWISVEYWSIRLPRMCVVPADATCSKQLINTLNTHLGYIVFIWSHVTQYSLIKTILKYTAVTLLEPRRCRDIEVWYKTMDVTQNAIPFHCHAIHLNYRHWTNLWTRHSLKGCTLIRATERKIMRN